jgi:hypothetical protein
MMRSFFHNHLPTFLIGALGGILLCGGVEARSFANSININDFLENNSYTPEEVAAIQTLGLDLDKVHGQVVKQRQLLSQQQSLQLLSSEVLTQLQAYKDQYQGLLDYRQTLAAFLQKPRNADVGLDALFVEMVRRQDRELAPALRPFRFLWDVNSDNRLDPLDLAKIRPAATLQHILQDIGELKKLGSSDAADFLQAWQRLVSRYQKAGVGGRCHLAKIVAPLPQTLGAAGGDPKVAALLHDVQFWIIWNWRFQLLEKGWSSVSLENETQNENLGEKALTINSDELTKNPDAPLEFFETYRDAHSLLDSRATLALGMRQFWGLLVPSTNAAPSTFPLSGLVPVGCGENQAVDFVAAEGRLVDVVNIGQWNLHADALVFNLRGISGNLNSSQEIFDEVQLRQSDAKEQTKTYGQLVTPSRQTAARDYVHALWRLASVLQVLPTAPQDGEIDLVQKAMADKNLQRVFDPLATQVAAAVVDREQTLRNEYTEVPHLEAQRDEIEAISTDRRSNEQNKLLAETNQKLSAIEREIEQRIEEVNIGRATHYYRYLYTQAFSGETSLLDEPLYGFLSNYFLQSSQLHALTQFVANQETWLDEVDFDGNGEFEPADLNLQSQFLTLPMVSNLPFSRAVIK